MSISPLRTKLERIFFDQPYDHHDSKIIKLLSFEDDEIERKYNEEPELFKEYFQPEKIFLIEPQTESEDSENDDLPPRQNINPVKFEDMDKTEPSHRYSNTRQSEFKMPFHRGIPNKDNRPPIAIGIINIDCIYDLKDRQIVMDRWINEISLIIQTNQNDFENSKAVLLLVEHKSEGIIKNFLKTTRWQEDLHGLDLFDNIVNAFYLIFLGLDYVHNKEHEIGKQIENARKTLVKLQIHDICALNEFTCIYEKNLFQIPSDEYTSWIEAYLLKLPLISAQCIERWKKEQTPLLNKSLAFATRIVKEEIAKICENRFKQKKLSSFSKSCCSAINEFENLEIGKKKYFPQKKKKKYYKKKFKSAWKKKKKRFSPGKYFKKPSKNKSCPQGKKKCRCWICNEEGHYANECPNRTKYKDKVKLLITAKKDGYEPIEDFYEGTLHIYSMNIIEYTSSEESSSSEENQSSSSED